jgi:pimeloyl-ACP methyl ester carboxylesterase
MTMTDSLVTIDGAALHVRIRGAGRPLVLVPGAGGDGDQYDELAERLSTSRTVVTYDRRANSRSPRPDGYAGTTIEEQADDLAGLLGALGLGRATVFGNSLGAAISLACALRSPDALAGLVLHEPALIAVLADPNAAMGAVQPVIGAGMESGGMRGGAEAFFRFADQPAYDALPEVVRDRMLDNGQVLFESEFGAFASWQPDAASVAALSMPVTVLTGRESRSPAFREAAQWVANLTSTNVVEAPGGHLGFVDHADQFAAVLSPALTG